MILDNKENQALLALLAYALFGQEMSIDAASINWDLVVAEANRHAVTALLYPSVKRLAGVPDAVVDRIRNAAMLSAAKADDMLHSQSEVIAALQEKGIPCAVLKGFSVAYCYPHPELRVPGDIDLLIGEEKLEAACAAMEKIGYMRDHETAMHVNFHGKGDSLELHRSASVFPESEKGRYAHAYMTQALQHVEQAEIDGISFPMLSLPYQMVSLLAHTERHMGSVGIGLRQICDWAVMIHAHREEISEKELIQLDRCGLLLFAKVITRICEKYLGLPGLSWTKDAPEETVDAVMQDIFLSGNFHVHNSRNRISSVMMDRAGENGKNSNIVRNYIHYVQKRVRWAGCTGSLGGNRQYGQRSHPPGRRTVRSSLYSLRKKLPLLALVGQMGGRIPVGAPHDDAKQSRRRIPPRHLRAGFLPLVCR